MDPASARPPQPWEPPRFSRDDLDQPKRMAVAAALGARDFQLVEGPPGTGKTTFISELVIAKLERNPGARILLAAQTHAALDNVLERVLEHAGKDVRMLRIARLEETRVAEGARHLLLDSQVERWRRAGISSGRKWLTEWAAKHGLDVKKLECGVNLQALGLALRLQEAPLRDHRQIAVLKLDDVKPVVPVL